MTDCLYLWYHPHSHPNHAKHHEKSLVSMKKTTRKRRAIYTPKGSIGEKYKKYISRNTHPKER
jgi:hypothetical protein